MQNKKLYFGNLVLLFFIGCLFLTLAVSNHFKTISYFLFFLLFLGHLCLYLYINRSKKKQDSKYPVLFLFTNAVIFLIFIRDLGDHQMLSNTYYYLTQGKNAVYLSQNLFILNLVYILLGIYFFCEETEKPKRKRSKKRKA